MTRDPQLTSRSLCASQSLWCHLQGFWGLGRDGGGGGGHLSLHRGQQCTGINPFLDRSLARSTEEHPRRRGITRPALTQSAQGVRP